MALTTGDKVPSCTLSVMGESGPAPLSTDDLFGGKRVLLFALPGAFTPGCSMAHLPGYVANADKIKAAGIDSIACLSVGFLKDARRAVQGYPQGYLRGP